MQKEAGTHSMIIEYKPRHLQKPERLLNVNSAWIGLEEVIDDILVTFDVRRATAIEFGVEFGYSTVALSNFFDRVVGVDTFGGDVHTRHKGDHYKQTRRRLAPYNNIRLYKSRFEDWIARDKAQYDLAHVDIVHTYEATYACGLWSAIHSHCTLFHDTESFPDVRRAVADICQTTGKSFYNYPLYHGLGIVVASR